MPTKKTCLGYKKIGPIYKKADPISESAFLLV